MQTESEQSQFALHESELDTRSLFSSVLLIEDDPGHARLIARALRGLVGEVITASSGARAIEILQEELFELVLCDLHLPDMHGSQLLKMVREMRPDLPVIVMTSSSSLDDAVNAMREGAWDYMIKQFSDDLVDRLKLVIVRTAGRKFAQMRELHLRAERDAFWDAVRTAQDGLAILGTSGIVVFANDRFEEFSNLVGFQVPHGEPFEITDVIAKADPGVAKTLAAYLRGPGAGGMWSSELRVELPKTEGEERPQERYFELAVSSAKLMGFSEEIEGAPVNEFRRSVLWVRDITRRKEQERFQRDLLSTTTHDLKGPLGAILTSAELLNHLVKSTDNRVIELIPRIASCARNSISLIDELLSARRIQDGVLVVKPNWYNVADVFEDVILDYLPVAKAKGLELTQQAVAPDFRVYADKIGLHRVLGNLVSNAVKFTSKGGKVELSASHEGSETRIAVTDTGSGIESANRTKLFERYSRLEQHQGIEGTGLGLYVTKNIVDAHGGRIEITSELGVGTTFIVCFPDKR